MEWRICGIMGSIIGVCVEFACDRSRAVDFVCSMEFRVANYLIVGAHICCAVRTRDSSQTWLYLVTLAIAHPVPLTRIFLLVCVCVCVWVASSVFIQFIIINTNHSAHSARAGATSPYSMSMWTYARNREIDTAPSTTTIYTRVTGSNL